MTEARITVVMFTYARTDYALATLRKLAENLRCSPDSVRLHIADDGSSEEHRAALVEFAESVWPGRVTVSNSERRGYGANYNLATMAMHDASDVLLCIEDDWELLRPLELAPLVADLMATDRFGCIRLSYIGFHAPLRGEFVVVNDTHYLLLDPESPELHVFSGNPRLETVAWQRNVGPWPEGLAPGETEVTVARRPEARQGVAWPADLIPPRGDLFAHIGSIKAETIGEPIHAS